jgi:hypothetical protein
MMQTHDLEIKHGDTNKATRINFQHKTLNPNDAFFPLTLAVI